MTEPSKYEIQVIVDQGCAAVAKLSPDTAGAVQRELEDLVQLRDPDLPPSPLSPEQALRLRSHMVEWDDKLKRLSAFELLALSEPISRLRELIQEFLEWRGVSNDDR